MIKKTAKKWHEWYSNPGSPATMAGTLTTESLGYLVSADEKAYLIITNVLIGSVHVLVIAIHMTGRV